MFAELLVVDDAESLLMYMLKLKVQPNIWALLKKRPSKHLVLLEGFWSIEGGRRLD